MGEAYFYHVTDTTPEAAVQMLIARAGSRGWQKIEVRGRDAARMDALDLALWQGPEEGFLPHGRAGGPHDALQPVLLTVAQPGVGRVAGIDCLMALDGVDVSVEEVQALARTCILFDGQDGDAVVRARIQWKLLTGGGCGAQYWAQDGGRWVMKQARPAS
jgi:DNA polymerase III subunit chi